MTEPWARVSLRVIAEGLTREELTRVLGPSEPAPPGNWSRSVETPSEEPLDDQLRRLTSLVEELAERVQSLDAKHEVVVLVSWTPRPGQDGLAVGHELIAGLARLRATLLIDTYSDD
jgi:hypothetical protein